MNYEFFEEGKNCTLFLSNGIKISGKLKLPPFFPVYGRWIKLYSKKSIIICNIDEVISIQYYFNKPFNDED